MDGYSIPEAADLLGMDPAEVRALAERGELDGECARGRWRISPEAVERKRFAAEDPEPPDTAELRERISALERRIAALEQADARRPMRPALEPLFRTSR